MADKWHRKLLDQTIARRHGLIDNEPLIEDAVGLI